MENSSMHTKPTTATIAWNAKRHSIIRKTKRFSIPERAVQYLKTKRTAPPPFRP